MKTSIPPAAPTKAPLRVRSNQRFQVPERGVTPAKHPARNGLAHASNPAALSLRIPLLTPVASPSDYLADFLLPDLQTIPHRGVVACLQFLFAKCPQRLLVRDLIKVSGLSGRGLHKAFRTHLGYGPGTALRRVRILIAARLLTDTDLAADQVAKQCGYRGGNSLCVAFQRYLKTSPVNFRHAQRRTNRSGRAGKDPAIRICAT